MKVSSKTFRTNICPYCHRNNKTVYWAGDREQIENAIKHSNDVVCKYCNRKYRAKDAVYFYDTLDGYVLSLSDNKKPDSKEALSLVSELNYKDSIVMAKVVGREFIKANPYIHNVDTSLIANNGNKLAIGIRINSSNGTYQLTSRPFELDVYLDVYRTIKDIVEDQNYIFGEKEATRAFEEYLRRNEC